MENQRFFALILIVLAVGAAAAAALIYSPEFLKEKFAMIWQLVEPEEEVLPPPGPAAQEPTEEDDAAAAATAAATADWQIYRNDEFKFGLKYPESLALKFESVWRPTEGTRKPILTALLEGDSLNVHIVTNAPGAPATTSEAEFIEEKTIKIGGEKISQKVFKEPDGQTLAIVGFEKNSVFYSIWATIAKDAQDQMTIFNQMLFTMRF